MPCLPLLLALFPSTASAVTFGGGDYGGSDVTLAPGDVITGPLVNVGTFTVPAGVLGIVAGEASVDAVDISVLGVLDGRGTGAPGGAGAPYAGAFAAAPGLPGLGLGGGGGGLEGPCAQGGGGSGAGHGGAGGDGSYVDTSHGAPPPGGAPYGSSTDVAGWEAGSGGGGAGGGCDFDTTAVEGGAGGAGLALRADTVRIDGVIDVSGMPGVNGSEDVDQSGSSGGGGGGSGGSILVWGYTSLTGAGVLLADGGDGGDGGPGLAGGGGGGAGGRIKIFYSNLLGSEMAISAAGGIAGASSGRTFLLPPTDGVFGSAVTSFQDQDSDSDGLPAPIDNCPDVYNPWQSDFDSDGLGDECDPDLDGDGIEPNGYDFCMWEPEDGGFDGLGGSTDPSDGCPEYCIDLQVDVEDDFHATSNPASGTWVYGRFDGNTFTRFTNRGDSGLPNALRHWRKDANLSSVPRVIDTYKVVGQSAVESVVNGTTYPPDALVLQPGIGKPAAVRWQVNPFTEGDLVTVFWSMTSARTSGADADVDVWVRFNGSRDLDLDESDDVWHLVGKATSGTGTTGPQQFTFLSSGFDVIDFVVDAHGGVHTNFDLVSLEVSSDETCPYFFEGESA